MTYSPETIQSLVLLAQQVISGIMKTDGTGFFGAIREAGALGTFVQESLERFKGNDLITGVAETLLSGVQSGEGGGVDLTALEPDQIISNLTQGISAVPDDANGAQFKGYLYELAEKIASAAGTGLFGGGEKVSAQEADFLQKLRGLLGV